MAGSILAGARSPDYVVGDGLLEAARLIADLLAKDGHGRD